MDGTHRWCIGLICGLFLIAATGILLLVKALRGPGVPTYSGVSSPERETERAFPVPAAQFESDLAGALQELLARTGFEPEEARDQPVRLGALTPASKQAPSSVQKAAERTGAWRVQRDLRKEVEEAVREGLRWARSEDDYSRAGVEYAEGEPDGEFEAILFNPEARDRLELCSKLLTNLQEMLRRDEFPQAQTQIERLIAALNDQAVQAEAELTCRTTVHESEVGTREDRQLYYFMAGVIQHLRGKGLFPELDALYRPGTTDFALDYDVRDAYTLLKQGCHVFAALEQTEMQKLLQTSDEEVRATIQRALPDPTRSSDPHQTEGRMG